WEAALHDETGKFLAIDFSEDHVYIGKAAIRDPHLLPVQHPILAIWRENSARARSLRVRPGLRLGEAVRRKPFAGRKLRQILLLLLLSAEINDRQRANSGVRAETHAERCVRRNFLREKCGGDAIEPGASEFVRYASAEQAEFASLLQQGRHQPRLFLLE